MLPFNSFKHVLRFQQYDSWEPEPQMKLPSTISLYQFVPALGMSREDGTASSLANTGQKQALQTERAMLSHHWKNAVCLLPGPQCTLTMQTNTLGGAIIFKCNLITERPACAVAPLQMSDNPLPSQTDRSCYFTSTHWGKPQENSSLSMGCNSRAISRPHAIWRYYLSTQTHKSPWSIFSEVYPGL